MSIQLPLLLAPASGLLPEPLGTIAGKVPFGGIHSFLMLLAVAPSMVMLVILLYELRGSRIDDESVTAEPLAEVDPKNLTQFMEEAIEQLNGIAVTLHNAIPKARQAPGQEASNHPAPSRHYLTFTLGDEQFAVSIQNIHGVVDAIQLVAEPSVPPKIRKAISLQGALVPVIDLGARFGGQPIELGRSSRIVILEVPGGDRLQLIGAVVDTVGDVLELPPVQIEPPAASYSRIRDDFTRGTLMLGNRPITLLDIGRGFSANEHVLRSAARPTKQENQPA